MAFVKYAVELEPSAIVPFSQFPLSDQLPFASLVQFPSIADTEPAKRTINSNTTARKSGFFLKSVIFSRPTGINPLAGTYHHPPQTKSDPSFVMLPEPAERAHDIPSILPDSCSMKPVACFNRTVTNHLKRSGELAPFLPLAL